LDVLKVALLSRLIGLFVKKPIKTNVLSIKIPV